MKNTLKSVLVALGFLANVYTAGAVSINVLENSATRTYLTITWDDDDAGNGLDTYFNGTGTVTVDVTDSSVYLANGQALIVTLESGDFTALPSDDSFSLFLSPSPDSFPTSVTAGPTHGSLAAFGSSRSVTYDYQVSSVPDSGSILGLLSTAILALASFRSRVGR